MHNMSSQQELMRVGSQCYLLLEQYKLRANLVGINMEKELIEPSYTYLQERVTDRYAVLFEKIKEEVAKLQTHFRIAQANSLRTLNNIFRNYRRRVGTLANEPLSSLKYGRYQRQQKMLLESIIYCQRQNKGEIRSLAAAVREVQQKYRRSDKIKEDYNTVFQIIDKSECYTYRYYEGFERTILTTITALQPTFDKLNAFLTVWENVGSTKAYQARSAREIQTQEKEHQSGERRLRPSSYQEQTEQQLEQLMKNCPQHSPQRQQYRKRLNQLRRYNSQKQKKLDMVGKMYSKRRNRAGILVNRGKEVSVLEWLINLDNSKVPYSYQDEFKHYRADNDHSQYRPTPYENHRPFKTAEEAREHFDKQRSQQLNHQWWYDRFGREGTLDLIAGESQQVQKRVEFEVVRQTELQNSDDRRKRELLEKQNYQMKENQRRDCLHVGYRHVHDKTELDSLMERTYHTQYIPGIEGQHDDLSFSDEEDHSFQEEQPPPRSIAETHPKKKEEIIRQDFPLIKLEQKIQAKPTLKFDPQPLGKVQKGFSQMIQPQMSLQQQIITTYFRQFSKKMTRKEQQPQYKKTAFLYFKDTASIDWSSLQAHLTCEKIFIYTHRSILFFSRIFSATQEKIKCNVYTIQDEEEEKEEAAQETIRHAVQQCFRNISLVTVKFHPIYLETQEVTSFMIGLLMVLVREGKMFEDSQIKDYVNEGKDIIEDFNEYYFPAEHKSTKSLFMRKFMPQASQELFAPKKQQQYNDNKSEASTTLTAQNSLPAKNKEIKQIKQPPKKELVDEPQKKEKVQMQKPSAILPSPQNSTPTYASLHEQPQLKRSNSREALLSMDVQLELSKQGQYQQGEQENDYEQL